MKLTLALFFPVMAFVFLFFSSGRGRITAYHGDMLEKTWSSVNPPAAKTGAPGETTCASCHTGLTQSAAGVVNVSFSGAGNEYTVGETYSVTVSIASGTKNGFQLTVLDGNNMKAGTLIAGANTSVVSFGGRQYARHSASSGLTSWTFDWMAPEADAGDLTMYYSFNKSNGLGNTSGDTIYLGQFNLASAAFNTVTAYEKTDHCLKVYWSQPAQRFYLEYDIDRDADVLLVVRSLSGQLVYSADMGRRSPGNYSEEFSADNCPAGIYLVSLFVDNTVFNRTVVVN